MKRSCALLFFAAVSAQAAFECEDIDLTESTLKGVPIQQQIGDSCYGYAAATFETALARRSSAADGLQEGRVCSPLEAMISDRRSKLRKYHSPYLPVVLNSGKRIFSVLGNGNLCSALEMPLKRKTCCQKFDFESDLKVPEFERSDLMGAWARGIARLFRKEDLSAEILRDDYLRDQEWHASTISADENEKSKRELSIRVLRFFDRFSPDSCGAQSENGDTRLSRLFKDVDAALEQISASQINDPLITVDLMMQKVCTKIPLFSKQGDSVGFKRACDSIPAERLNGVHSGKAFAALKDSLLKERLPVGVEFCSNAVFSDPASDGSKSEDACGDHAVLAIGMKKGKDGGCWIRLRNSWGSDCDAYPQKEGIECVAQGAYAGDVFVQAELLFSPKIGRASVACIH